ncbi:MAG: hypothetical protein WCV68_02245 [Candidatus Paceibacterota bacterium]|jgi:hypothetical protein
MDKENTNIAIVIALVVVIIFFGGWYVFFGQLYNKEANTEATVQENPQIEQSGLVTPEVESTTTTIELPVQ